MTTAIRRTPAELAAGIQQNFANMTVQIAAEYISPDCRLHEAPSLPFGGIWIGPQGFVDCMARIQQTFLEFGFDPGSMVTAGDLLAFTGTVHGRTPKGSFTMPLVEYWSCRDGKIREIFAMWQDTKQVCALL